jgi:hypothetical protein
MLRSFGHRRHQARRWVALGAAYLLMLQAVISGISAGAVAGPPVPAICSSVHAAAGLDGSSRQPDHSHLPRCCALGCNMSGPSTVAPPGAAWLPVRRTFVDAAPSPFGRDRVDLQREHVRPGPRGPPLAA